VPRIGHTEQAVVLRTDFSDEPAWRTACTEMMAETVEGFRAYVDIVEDPAFDGFGIDEILHAIGEDYDWSFLIVADDVTMVEEEHPFLVLDLFHERGRSFRALPGEIQGIENNLSIANMDFWEFADWADGDGVFRGFEQPEG
jgi:Domain of unknown function (DUF6924)